jgi:hypothetical protein
MPIQLCCTIRNAGPASGRRRGQAQETGHAAEVYRAKTSLMGLGLITKPLLVAVLLHALLALVLIDLGFTTFLDGAHGVLFGLRRKIWGKGLVRGDSLKSRSCSVGIR